MNHLAVVMSSLVLIACGGGGGGGSSAPPPATTAPVASSLSFPLKAAFSSRTASGATETLSANSTVATRAVDGDCSGTLKRTTGPALAGAIFEGASVLSAVSVTTITFSNCTPASAIDTSTSYFDTNYLPLGSSKLPSDYGVYLVPPTIPTSVKVGDVGVVGTQTIYFNSSKNSIPPIKATVVSSYIVEADTASTAIVNLITKRYHLGSSSQPLFTEQARFRISSTGALTAMSVDIRYDSGLYLLFK